MTRPAAIVIYQKPTCTTCRAVHRALKESGVDFDAVDYYVEPISRTKLVELLGKMGMRPRDLLRIKEPIYRQLGLENRERSDDEITGAVGAAGRLAGIKNLGAWKPLDPNSHLEYASAPLSKDGAKMTALAPSRNRKGWLSSKATSNPRIIVPPTAPAV